MIPFGTALDMKNLQINNLANPTEAQDAATKQYVDTKEVSLDNIGDPAANTNINLADKTVTWNFTNPSGGWKFNVTGAAQGHFFEILQSGGNPAGDMHLIHIEASDVDPTMIHAVPGSATSNALKVNIPGENMGPGRFLIDASGKMSWGDGTNAVDTNLYRSAANTLKTDDTFLAANISGTNTGDETASTIRTKLGITTLSGSNTGDQNIFSTIAVSGQSNVVADSTSDTLTLAAGSNITITTNASTDTITIASTGGGITALTGDVTASGSGSVAAAIANNSVTLAKMAQVATGSFLGRVSASTGNVEALTTLQAQTQLGVADGWVSATQGWAYLSASQIIAAGDYTALFSIGDKIKFTQTTTKYFYVSRSVFGGVNTVLTLVAINGTDTVANSALSNIAYSKFFSPAGMANPTQGPDLHTYAYRSGSGQTYAANNFTTVVCNNVINAPGSDPRGWYNTSTGIFLPTIPGHYLMIAQARSSSGSSASLVSVLNVGGINYGYSGEPMASSTGTVGGQVLGSAYFNGSTTSAYFSVWCSGNARTSDFGLYGYVSFSAKYLGP